MCTFAGSPSILHNLATEDDTPAAPLTKRSKLSSKMVDLHGLATTDDDMPDSQQPLPDLIAASPGGFSALAADAGTHIPAWPEPELRTIRDESGKRVVEIETDLKYIDDGYR